MIFEYFLVTGAHEAILDYTDQFSISVQADDIQAFDTRWDQALISKEGLTMDSVLESLYKM